MPSLSVIVPVYKVEKYLDRCVESILSQDYKDFELILVDDGSPDNCGKMCDDWMKSDERIRVIHKENGGLSSARNAGYDVARGKYISFVDSDDSILAGMFSDMIAQLEKNNLDMISCLAQVVYETRIKMHKSDGSLLILNRLNALNYCIKNENVSAWGKVFTRKAVGEVRFPVGRIYEDTACMYRFIDNCVKVGYLNKTYYNYFFNLGSISKNGFNVKARFDFVLSTKEVYEFAKSAGLECVQEAKGQYIRRLLACLTAIYANGVDDNSQKYLEFLANEIYKCRDKDSYSLVKGKYKLFLWCFGRFDIVHKLGARLSKFGKWVSNEIK